MFTVDEHGGQAKGTVKQFLSVIVMKYSTLSGIGLHLRRLAQDPDLRQCRDLHEPDRCLGSLSEYEHIHRLLRLCNVHVHRKIKIALVPEDVKVQMHNLMCISHPGWDDALADICTQGGQEGTGKRHNNLNG